MAYFEPRIYRAVNAGPLRFDIMKLCKPQCNVNSNVNVTVNVYVNANVYCKCNCNVNHKSDLV